MTKKENIDLAGLAKELNGLNAGETAKEKKTVTKKATEKKTQEQEEPGDGEEKKASKKDSVKKVLASPSFGKGDKSWKNFLRAAVESDTTKGSRQLSLSRDNTEALLVLANKGISLTLDQLVNGIVTSFLKNHKKEVKRIKKA